MSVREELEQLVDINGLLHPRAVVEWARNHPGSELHRAFEWNVEKAAYAHWLWQARQLIIVHVRDDFGERTTFSLVSDRRHGGGYRDLEEVLNTEEMRQEAVTQALAELQRWRDRHTHLRPELAGIFRAIDRRLSPAPTLPRSTLGDEPRPSA